MVIVGAPELFWSLLRDLYIESEGWVPKISVWCRGPLYAVAFANLCKEFDLFFAKIGSRAYGDYFTSRKFHLNNMLSGRELRRPGVGGSGIPSIGRFHSVN